MVIISHLKQSRLAQLLGGYYDLFWWTCGLILPYLEHIPHKERQYQQHSGLVLLPVTYSKQQTGLWINLENSMAKKRLKQHTLELLLRRVAWGCKWGKNSKQNATWSTDVGCKSLKFPMSKGFNIGVLNTACHSSCSCPYPKCVKLWPLKWSTSSPWDASTLRTAVTNLAQDKVEPFSKRNSGPGDSPGETNGAYS